jgi:hypothetical protein
MGNFWAVPLLRSVIDMNTSAFASEIPLLLPHEDQPVNVMY